MIRRGILSIHQGKATIFVCNKHYPRPLSMLYKEAYDDLFMTSWDNMLLDKSSMFLLIAGLNRKHYSIQYDVKFSSFKILMLPF